jgi:methylmalonyl-CoA mutase N-terminal domain/subunit
MRNPFCDTEDPLMTSLKPGSASEAAQRPDPETVTLSGYEVSEVYGPERIETLDAGDPTRAHERIGEPGAYPFTRGVHPTMYRSRLWTMRQFAGFGSADDTNRRFKYLLENAKGTKANTGLSTAFDLPTIRCPRARSDGAASRSTPSTTCTVSTPTFRSARSPSVRPSTVRRA